MVMMTSTVLRTIGTVSIILIIFPRHVRVQRLFLQLYTLSHFSAAFVFDRFHYLQDVHTKPWVISNIYFLHSFKHDISSYLFEHPPVHIYITELHGPHAIDNSESLDENLLSNCHYFVQTLFQAAEMGTFTSKFYFLIITTRAISRKCILNTISSVERLPSIEVLTNFHSNETSRLLLGWVSQSGHPYKIYAILCRMWFDQRVQIFTNRKSPALLMCVIVQYEPEANTCSRLNDKFISECTRSFKRLVRDLHHNDGDLPLSVRNFQLVLSTLRRRNKWSLVIYYPLSWLHQMVTKLTYYCFLTPYRYLLC